MTPLPMIVVCREYREIKERSQNAKLLGFAHLFLPDVGLLLQNCALKCRGDERWIDAPFRTYERNGRNEYESHWTWKDKATREEFNRAALAAIDKYIAANTARRAS